MSSIPSFYQASDGALAQGVIMVSLPCGCQFAFDFPLSDTFSDIAKTYIEFAVSREKTHSSGKVPK